MAHFWRVPNGKGGFEMKEVDPRTIVPIDLSPPTSVTLGERQPIVCDVCQRKFRSHDTFSTHFTRKHGDLKVNPDSWKSYAGVTH